MQVLMILPYIAFNMQTNMHDMQNMQTSFSICRICTAHFADVRISNSEQTMFELSQAMRASDLTSSPVVYPDYYSTPYDQIGRISEMDTAMLGGVGSGRGSSAPNNVLSRSRASVAHGTARGRTLSLPRQESALGVERAGPRGNHGPGGRCTRSEPRLGSHTWTGSSPAPT